MEFEDLQQIIAVSLDYEEPSNLTRETKLKDLTDDPVELLDVARRAKIKYMNFTSGERLTKEAVCGLARIARTYKSMNLRERAKHFLTLGKSNNIYSFSANASLNDILDIGNYQNGVGLGK